MENSNDTHGLLFGPEPKGGPKWGQQRRLEFIDYRLNWDRSLNRSDLRDFFGISVPQASLDISEYLKRAPYNLEYDPKTKTYRASNSFKPIYPTSNLTTYLEDLLRMATAVEMPYGSFLGWTPSVASVPRPGRRLVANIVLAVVHAMRNLQKINICYQSISDFDPAIRAISPHTLVHDGYRWHVRAYCHQREEFRDFLLSRILGVLDSEKDIPRIELDVTWNKIVCLKLAPHPLLSPSQKKLIELDYDMTDGVYKIECRQALIFYIFRQLGLERDYSNVDPNAQQIILSNIDEIKDYLPTSSVR